MVIVVTSKEIKLYRMRDGFMQILHSNVFDDPQSTIKCFKQDKRHRKCYVVSNKGVVKVLNILNGVALKTLVAKPSKKVNEFESSDSDEDVGGKEDDDGSVSGASSPNVSPPASPDRRARSPQRSPTRGAFQRKILPQE